MVNFPVFRPGETIEAPREVVGCRWRNQCLRDDLRVSVLSGQVRGKRHNVRIQVIIVRINRPMMLRNCSRLDRNGQVLNS